MKIYKKVFSYVPEKSIFAYLSMLASIVSAVLLIYGYYLIFLFLKTLLVLNDYQEAKTFAIRIVIFLTISSVMYFLSGLLSHIFAYRLETNLRKKGIEGLTDSSFRFFDLNSSGFIRKTIDDNAAKTHMAVAHMIPDSIQATIIPILTLALSFVISLRLGIAAVVLTICCGFIMKLMMGEREFLKIYQASLDKLSSETVEYIRGIQVVKIFGNKLKSFKALHEAIINYSKNAYNYSISCKIPYVIYQLVFLCVIPIVLIPLSFFLGKFKSPEFLVLELIMLFFLSGVIMVSFMKIMWFSMHIFEATYAVESVEKIYNNMNKDKLSYGEKEYFDNFNIEFDNVSFSYGEKKVLEKLSFKLDEKKTYALVGHSGSGKSTIAKLLSGFYKVDSGDIKIGKNSLESYTKEAIVNNISFIFQDSKLFKKSIYENVALGKKDASRDEIMNALKLAECEEIINKFSDKENTIIGSKGVYLSGGEKQRIAIARAILKNANIIIMDEASAAIDSDNEYKLQQAFKNLMKDKTVIMIAHRLTSIKNVDEILVIDKGEIIERGSHNELINTDTAYNRFFNNYNMANEWRMTNERIS